MVDKKTPVLDLLRKIEDNDLASRVIILVNGLRINYVEDFVNHRSDAVEDSFGTDTKQSDFQFLKELLQREYNLSLLPSLKVSVATLCELVGQINGQDVAREVLRFAQLQGAQTISDLCKYSVAYLKEKGVSQSTIEATSQALKDRYKTSFGDTPPTTSTQENSLTNHIVRNYDVLDQGDHLLVNGVRVDLINRRGKAMSKEELIKLYELHSNGDNPKEIAGKLERTELTIVAQLRKVEVMPQAKSRETHNYTRRPLAASGCPPPSLSETIHNSSQGLYGALTKR